MSTLKPEIHSHDNPQALTESAARLIAAAIKQQITEKGRCRLALAGGNTPRPIYQRLAQTDLATDIDWDKVDIFWGDERCVDANNMASNFHMAQTALISQIPLASSNSHRIQVELGAQAAATQYAELLTDKPLDIVLLGMGGDGHVASLFPDTPDLAGNKHAVATLSPIPPIERVSISLHAINQAAEVYLFVAGADKARRLAEVYDQIDTGKADLPAAQVQPRSGRLFWLCDSAATRLLPKQNTD